MERLALLFVGIVVLALVVLAATRVMATPPPFDASFQWTSRESPTTSPWSSVAYGDGMFVAVASNGGITTSVDGGVTWTPSPTPGGNAWRSVTYGNKTFVAVSNSGARRVMTSTNGQDWTLRASANDSLPWRGVAYGKGKFVAVSSHSRGGVMRSTDNGATWSMVKAPASQWTDVTYGNGLFVANSLSKIMTSPNGVRWTPKTSPSKAISALVAANGLFVVTASLGNTRLFTSTDAVTWTAYPGVGSGSHWRSLAYGNGLFVAVASAGSQRVLTSKDGVAWVLEDIGVPPMQWSSVAYGDGVFVAVANDVVDKSMTRIMSYSKRVEDDVTPVQPASDTVPLPTSSSSSTTGPGTVPPATGFFAALRKFFQTLF